MAQLEEELQIGLVVGLRIGREVLVACPANWPTGLDQILHIRPFEILPYLQETAERPCPYSEDRPFPFRSCFRSWTAWIAGVAFRTEAVVHKHLEEERRSHQELPGEYS